MTVAATSRREAWTMAVRPHTLPAGAAPVLVGTGVAVGKGVFAPLPTLAALAGALLIQVGTNLANDYYDAQSGADAEREGFTRVTEAGLLPPERVKRAMVATYALAVVVGMYLVYVGGIPIVLVGLGGIAAGILYTGGPWPYGYRGLGDLFVFVFFGVVAATGTYYVQAVAHAGATLPVTPPPGTVPTVAILASLPMAGLSTAILVVNNLRDRETDAAAGKKTLAVYLGERWTRIEYGALVGLAYLVPPVLFTTHGYSVLVLLPLLTLPLAISIGRTVARRTDAEALDPALSRTGRLLFAYAVLFAVGLGVPALEPGTLPVIG